MSEEKLTPERPPQNNSAINLLQKFSLFSEHWQPKVIAEMNDYQFKLARLSGEFVWHSHQETDETFIVLEGELRILIRSTTGQPDSEVRLGKGELYVVPRGVEHKPVAENEALVMLIEPRGVVNTGNDAEREHAPNDVWI